MLQLLTVLLFFGPICQTLGHGAVVYPPPRNNIDFDIAPWSGNVPNPVPAVDDQKTGFWCPVPGQIGQLSEE